MSYKNKVEVSEFDKKALVIIRKNVEKFLEDSAKKFDKNGILLDIAPQDYEGAKKFFKKMKIDTIDIDPNTNTTYIGDITKNNEFLKKKIYDIVVMTEVIEHVLNPFSAIDEIYRILKKNGLLLLTTPFNFRIHGPLPDCWRFTEYGLKILLKKFNEIVITKIKTLDRNLMPIHYAVMAKK